ncbi:transcriptional regulator [Dyella jiangningensis]|nr:transcriptional regulator [Dyella jiangningensis]AHX15957.1 transcriptional regulator [Dyella jiangningensis]
MNNRIRVLREARGLTLDSLASKAGTTNQQLSLLEIGKRRLTVDWLLRLAIPLGCHPWELVASSLPEAPLSEEVHLLERFRTLTQDQKVALLRLVETMAPATPYSAPVSL